MADILELYKMLMVEKPHLKKWHDNYESFFKQTSKLKEDLKELSAKNDKEFLKKLIFEKSNDIASRGSSTISNDHFDKLINNSAFMAALNKYILNQNSDTYVAMGTAWYKAINKNNPVIVNRIAAAFNIDLSTTIDASKFNDVYEWLVEYEFIKKDNNATNWFTKNIDLITQLRDSTPKDDKSQDSNLYDDFYINIFVWVLYEYINYPFSLKKQVIRYGAPGTGKTYSAKENIKNLIFNWTSEISINIGDDKASLTDEYNFQNNVELIQFHPSFSYEDFIEGLRPSLNKGESQLVLTNGVFKDFCMKAGKWEIDLYNVDSELDFNKVKLEEIVQYEEKLKSPHWSYIHRISDKKMPLSKAVPPYFFIIDEINRAELSRVFGELMYCLEYRGVKEAVKTQYANLNTEYTGMFRSADTYKFFIPENLFMLGTMNTIDRSVESFDFALRRRFQWEEVTPKYDVIDGLYADNIKNSLRNLNKLISNEVLLGPEYQIGQAYVMGIDDSRKMPEKAYKEFLWENCIKSLLHEYLRGTGKEQELLDNSKNEFMGNK